MLENLMADLRRVYCLYRVSMLGQVEKDDIKTCALRRSRSSKAPAV